MVNISPRKMIACAQLLEDCQWQEQQIQATLSKLSQGSFKDIKAAVHHHSIPHSTLYHCHKERKIHLEASKHLQALLEEAKEVLCHPELTSYYSQVMDSQKVLASNPKIVEAVKP
ncbi:related to transposase [Sporisorium scitamineum]|uniref:Related to transposase n=1 Tax=Sporisorium scitamineum TaxID=49012 RepID=A0A127Z912_9BASI|nr:related to transposase [Sporisorium scitamineum]